MLGGQSDQKNTENRDSIYHTRLIGLSVCRHRLWTTRR